MDIRNSIFAAAAAVLLTSGAAAQYRQFAVEDFESTAGKWPATFEHGHHSTPLTTRTVTWAATEKGGVLHAGPAGVVVGNYGLELRPLESDPHLSVMDRRALERNKLGANGAALFQVDFYFDEDEGNHPTLAILANASEGTDRSVYRFYRFGVDRDRIYFSFTNNKSTPDMYLRQALSEFNLTRPGWHRLQMIFRGADEIMCAIDGQLTSFSPISDSTLARIEPGIMVTRSKEGGDRAVYADNLSILWTPNANDDPPGSPWLVRSSVAVPAKGMQANRWSIGGQQWTTSPSDAWKRASAENKVILALFHGDDLAANENVIALLGSEEAKPVLTQCVTLRVDVGESSGQVFAGRYGLKEYPTVAVIGPDGNMINNVPVQPGSGLTWTKVFEMLQGG